MRPETKSKSPPTAIAQAQSSSARCAAIHFSCSGTPRATSRMSGRAALTRRTASSSATNPSQTPATFSAGWALRAFAAAASATPGPAP